MIIFVYSISIQYKSILAIRVKQILLEFVFRIRELNLEISLLLFWNISSRPAPKGTKIFLS